MLTSSEIDLSFDEKTSSDVLKRIQLPINFHFPQLRSDLEKVFEANVARANGQSIAGFIAAHSAPVALREGILYVRVLQPALHYELEQISKTEILRKLKQRFGSKTIRDVRFRVG
jgi:hypothetical protein